MAMNTVSLCGVNRNRTDAAQDICSVSDWLKVHGVDASMHTTQMIEHQSGWNLPDEMLIRPTMREHHALAYAQPCIALRIESAMPYPATIFVNDEIGFETSKRVVGADHQWVAVLTPAPIVLVAISTSLAWLITTVNRTYAG